MNWRLILVPSVAALLGIAAGWALSRWLGRRAEWWLVGGLIFGALVLILAGRAAQGMEGLGYVVMAIFMAVPAAIGASLGGFLARRGQM
mgnify:FL=1